MPLAGGVAANRVSQSDVSWRRRKGRQHRGHALRVADAARRQCNVRIPDARASRVAGFGDGQPAPSCIRVQPELACVELRNRRTQRRDRARAISDRCAHEQRQRSRPPNTFAFQPSNVIECGIYGTDVGLDMHDGVREQ